MSTPEEPATAPDSLPVVPPAATVANPVPPTERQRWSGGKIALISGGAVLALVLVFGGGVVVGHVTADHGRGQFPGSSQGGFRPDGGGPGVGAPGHGDRNGGSQNGHDEGDQSDDSDN